MSNLRELTNAELDMIGGGAEKISEPIRRVNPIIVVLEDILRIVERIEGNNPGRPM